MAKVVQYKFLACEVNHGTEENPKIEPKYYYRKFECETQAEFDANYLLAEKEAVPGTIKVTGEFDPEPEAQPTDAERIAELEEALAMLLSGVTE